MFSTNKRIIQHFTTGKKATQTNKRIVESAKAIAARMEAEGMTVQLYIDGNAAAIGFNDEAAFRRIAREVMATL